MRLALLADLHANREAVEACLSKLRKLGFDRVVILGDIVGYGADPEWAVDTVQRLVDEGAIAVHGNHDEAIWSPRGEDAPMHAHAQAAVTWTRSRLSAAQTAFLSQLPVSVDDDDRLYVHANAWAPKQWGYIANELAAAKSMDATSRRITFCGHVHEPALYHSHSTGGARHFSPTPGVAIPLIASRRWLALPGSVGQPRDGHAAACCALYDTARNALTLLRVAYDHHAAAQKIVQAGLPQALAQRLIEGC